MATTLFYSFMMMCVTARGLGNNQSPPAPCQLLEIPASLILHFFSFEKPFHTDIHHNHHFCFIPKTTKITADNDNNLKKKRLILSFSLHTNIAKKSVTNDCKPVFKSWNSFKSKPAFILDSI